MHDYRSQPPHGGNSGNPQDNYFRFPQNVSPEMLNYGLTAGQDLISKQRDRFMPGVSGFWISLKYYFAVSYALIVVLVIQQSRKQRSSTLF